MPSLRTASSSEREDDGDKPTKILTKLAHLLPLPIAVSLLLSGCGVVQNAVTGFQKPAVVTAESDPLNTYLEHETYKRNLCDILRVTIPHSGTETAASREYHNDDIAYVQVAGDFWRRHTGYFQDVMDEP